ncbi:GMC family oxidoreductase [Metallumcola ferriviriculae]|uniref:GMC family oxidoreductase n=1 Tax=Metallumcola ferriviriculae TaxID=3039180 RepID=A0AAU0UK66_9FIRM|nr:GMC family oxidoreductase [Desulfitibacteraceae bacterium MK1]
MKNNNDYVTHNHDHYKDHRQRDLANRKYKDGADICIVGAGAAGGVLAYELSKAGFSVVVIEAGPFWNPQTDFASDELAAQSLAWQDTRLSTGKDALTFGHNNSGRGVGGGTVHFTGVFLRFHESDFKTKTIDGVGEDWPIEYQDLAPYYDKIERDIAVSGPKEFPWGSFHGPYPYPERNPISANSQVFRKGCDRLGIKSVVAPLAILSAPFDGRPPCISRGFCNQGCMPNSKFSTLIHHIPKAIGYGAEVLSDCMVTRIELDDQGKAKGVTFNHDGKEHFQKAKLVIVSAFAVETPRLLLNSTCSKFPQGLANSSGLVGRYLLTHTGHDIYAKFDDEVRLYKGTPVMALSQDFYETDRSRGFARGYTMNAHGGRPVSLAKNLAVSAGIWGSDLYEIMRDYNFYARITIVGEVLPDYNNFVTLSEEKDEYGIPRALASFSYGDNDNKMIAHGVAKANEILEAADGKAAFVIPDSAHLMGGCRMGRDPAASVVDEFCRSHDISNLYICDASAFVTSGGGNPTETVMAIAARTAQHIINSR